MHKNDYILLTLILMFTACGFQSQKETYMIFVDDVKKVLADSGRIDLTCLQ